eukprot:m.64527 g.64527  ORF g.64527 m.64527 type:complete len:53 (-) comp23441_c0_seq1:97-255(-)
MIWNHVRCCGGCGGCGGAMSVLNNKFSVNSGFIAQGSDLTLVKGAQNSENLP